MIAAEPMPNSKSLRRSKISLKDRLKEFTSDLDTHEVFLVAGSIAYTTALALAPFLLIMLTLASFLSTEIQQKIYTQMTETVGEKAGAMVQAIIENADQNSNISGISGIIGLLVLAVSASAIFSQLRIALDKINEHKATKNESGIMGFIKDRFFSVGLVFGFAFLTIVSLLLTTMMAVVFVGGEGVIWQAVAFAINFLLFSVLFSALYRFIPSDTLDFKRCFVAGSVSAVFYLIGKTIIGIYLGKAGLESSYGAAGSLIVFLAWVYYTALTLLVSYEFTTNFLYPTSSQQNEQTLSRRPVGRRV